MSATVFSRAVPNLIQGVTQQAPQQARDSQCVEQVNCINSPKDGAVARNGAAYAFPIEGDLINNAFHYIARGGSERYLCILSGSAAPRVFNLDTGAPCAVSVVPPATSAYVTAGTLPAVDRFVLKTVGDTTFVANRDVSPQMLPALSSTRPKECLVFFKAGGYVVTYTLSLFFGGVQYRWRYTTPDNSAGSNANFIGTSFLAATFYRAMTNTIAPQGTLTTGGVGAGGVGGDGTGVPSVLDKPPSSPTLASLGFSIEINGNLLRIWRTDGQDFRVEATDTVGDTYVSALKDNVRSLSDLPRGGFEGMIFTVRAQSSTSGRAGENEADYFVEFVGLNPSSGFWRERAAPGVPTQLDAATMPHTLVCTGLNTFEFRRPSWSTRIAGDLQSSPNPGFIDRRIEDLFYQQNRLAIITESTVSYSKPFNPYTFFRDTARTVLSTDPFTIEPNDTGTTALLKRSVAVDEGYNVWAQDVQFRVTSGQNKFEQDSAEALPSSNYQFSERCNVEKIGKGVFFVTEPDNRVQVRLVQYQQGRAAGDSDVTDHVSDYIPAGALRMTGTDSGRMLFVLTEANRRSLYLYNFLMQGNEFVQSAWSRWEYPWFIHWAIVLRDELWLVVADYPASQSLVLRESLRPAYIYQTAPNGEARGRLDGATRYDFFGATYDGANGEVIYVAAYGVPPEVYNGLRLFVAGPPAFDRPEPYPVGASLKAVPQRPGDPPTYIRFKAREDLRFAPVNIGFVVPAWRDELPYYIRGPRGVVPADDLVVSEFTVHHALTGYYRVEVNQGNGRLKSYALKALDLGTPNEAIGAAVQLDTGSVRAGVDSGNLQARIRIINDSVYPSRWQAAEYKYRATLRAVPSAARLGE